MENVNFTPHLDHLDCDYGYHTSKRASAGAGHLHSGYCKKANNMLIMSMVAVPEVLETVLLGVVERSIAVASDRLVGGRLKLQQLEAAMDILQGKDVHEPLKEGKAKRFDPYLWFAALVCQLV